MGTSPAAKSSAETRPGQDWLPLKPDLFAILLVLLEDDCHGYGIMQRATRQSGGRTQLQPGALYRLLKRLLDGGLVAEVDRRLVDAQSDERRRYYSITEFGRQVAAAEAQRMAELVRVSRAHRLIEGSES